MSADWATVSKTKISKISKTVSFHSYISTTLQSICNCKIVITILFHTPWENLDDKYCAWRSLSCFAPTIRTVPVEQIVTADFFNLEMEILAFFVSDCTSRTLGDARRTALGVGWKSSSYDWHEPSGMESFGLMHKNRSTWTVILRHYFCIAAVTLWA